MSYNIRLKIKVKSSINFALEKAMNENGLIENSSENKIEVNRKEIERYLGYRRISPEAGDEVDRLIESCLENMQKSVSPKYIYKTFTIEWDGEDCSFSEIKVKKGNLTKNLKGCDEIVMMAVTLGPSPDMLVRRSELRNTLESYVYQAVGAAMAEAWCEKINEKIRLEAEARGLYTRPRFSPGYGDFPLEVQRSFERILNMPKTIGVSLSDSLLMVPTKSITAVIGLSKQQVDCHKMGCEECSMSGTCEYSRTEK